MRNFIQPGNTITIPAGANYASGEVVVAGELVGIASGAAVSGSTVDVSLVGVYSVAKVSANTFSVGSAVHYDAGDKLATSDADSGANKLLGHAVEAAGNGAASVKVRLAN